MSDLILTNLDLWTGLDDAPLPEMTVRVVDGRISAIEEGAVTEPGAVDLGGATVIPGLVDAHVHLTTTSILSKPTDNAIYRALTPEPEKLLHGLRNSMRSLAAGFTTLRVMGHRGVGEVQLRDFIDGGLLPGPRMLVAPWPISMTGGRGDLFWPATAPRDPEDTADGIDECLKMVRLQRKRGADFIKVTASGGMLSAGDRPHWPNYTFDELRAITEEAHTYDMRVAAHAHSAEGIKRALRAGFDTIEHGSFLDDECLELMLASGAHLVPTLAITDWILRSQEASGASPEGIAKLRDAGRRQTEAFQRAYAAGVPVAMGTDTSGTICPPGQHAREMELYVQAGLTPAQALRTATVVAAEALGVDAEIGSIEVGKVADLVAAAGDPTQDIGLLRRPGGIAKVYRAGRDVTEPWPALSPMLDHR